MIALGEILGEVSSLRAAVDRLNANQIAAEKRRQIPAGMFGGGNAPMNALAAFGANTPTLGEYLLQKASEAPSTPATNALSQTIADILLADAEKKK
jgi:hypothetical protein